MSIPCTSGSVSSVDDSRMKRTTGWSLLRRTEVWVQGTVYLAILMRLSIPRRSWWLLQGSVCFLSSVTNPPYVQCHFDAKARPGFIVTPTRHIERLSQMDDEELFALWSVAVKAVRYLQLSGWNFCTLPVFVLIFKLQFLCWILCDFYILPVFCPHLSTHNLCCKRERKSRYRMELEE